MIQSLNKAFILTCFCVSMISSPTKAQQMQNDGNIVSTEMVKILVQNNSFIGILPAGESFYTMSVFISKNKVTNDFYIDFYFEQEVHQEHIFPFEKEQPIKIQLFKGKDVVLNSTEIYKLEEPKMGIGETHRVTDNVTVSTNTSTHSFDVTYTDPTRTQSMSYWSGRNRGVLRYQVTADELANILDSGIKRIYFLGFPERDNKKPYNVRWEDKSFSNQLINKLKNFNKTYSFK